MALEPPHRRPPRRVPALRRVRPAARDPVQRRTARSGAASRPSQSGHTCTDTGGPPPVDAASTSSTSTRNDGRTTSHGCVDARRTAARASRPRRRAAATATTSSSATSATTGSSAAPATTRSGAAGATTCMNADDDLVDRLRRRRQRTASATQSADTWLNDIARHAPELRGPRLRRRRPRHPDRQHRRRPADRLGRRVQQLPRPVRAVRHRHRQPPGRRRRCSSSSTRSRRRRAPTRRARPTTTRSSTPRGTASRTARSASSRRRITASGSSRPAARPTRRPGNIPGGRRDVLRSADFNDGTLHRLRARQRRLGRSPAATLQVAAASLGQDAAAVFYVDQTLPTYYELLAPVLVQKPTAGWNGERVRDLRLLLADRLQVRRASTSALEQGRARPPRRRRAGSSTRPGVVTRQRRVGHVLRPAGRRERPRRHRARQRRRSVLTQAARPALHRRRRRTASTWASSASARTTRAASSTTSPSRSCRRSRRSRTPRTSTDGVADLFTGDAAGTWAVVGAAATPARASSSAAGDEPDEPAGARAATPRSYVECETVRLGAGGSAASSSTTTRADDFKYVTLDPTAGTVVDRPPDQEQVGRPTRPFAATLAAGRRPQADARAQRHDRHRARSTARSSARSPTTATSSTAASACSAGPARRRSTTSRVQIGTHVVNVARQHAADADGAGRRHALDRRRARRRRSSATATLGTATATDNVGARVGRRAPASRPGTSSRSA